MTFGDPVLRSRASDVSEFGPELAAEAERMVAIMRDAMGVGLAATQLGDAAAVARVPGRPGRRGDGGRQPADRVALRRAGDGGGGLPEPARDRGRRRARAARPGDAAQDVHGEPLLLEASGLEARVLQHEIDHLDGVLILDRTAREQRKGAMRALREGDTYSPDPTDPEPADG